MHTDAATLDPPAVAEASPKRRQMLDAARRLFLAQGYGAVSMDAVARTAGVSKATLYAHFASKAALFGMLMADGCSQMLLPEENLFPAEVADLRPALEALGGRTLRFMLREDWLAIYRIAMAESVRFPELARSFYANGPVRTLARTRDWIAQQQAAGKVRADAEPEMAAQHLMALLRSALFLRATLGLPPAPEGADIDRAVAGAVDTWLRAFAVAPAR
jgi:TetR/AcrR family transcriptional repressor of mexJK operon